MKKMAMIFNHKKKTRSLKCFMNSSMSLLNKIGNSHLCLSTLFIQSVILTTFDIESQIDTNSEIVKRYHLWQHRDNH